MDAKEAYRGSLLFDSDCGAFNALDVDQKEEASPWAGLGELPPLHSGRL